MKKRILLFLLAMAAAGAASRHDAAGLSQAFQANDTVCYVGDSITHGGTYHSIVTLFYATRFPDRPIRFYNEGIGGDRASNIMSDERYRLQVDILAHKPTVASIMLGMNDIGRTDYAEGKSGPEVEQKRQASLDTYRESMTKLIAALQGAGARLVLITPSIYEEAAKFATADPPPAALTAGSNAALGKCADMVRQFARQYHTGLADFWGEMNEVNAQQRKTDPLFSVVGPNRVHPGPVGHFVMAYAFLKAQDVPHEVAVIGVDAGKKKAAKALNCRIEKVQAGKDSVEFDATEGSLPLVVPEDARPALPLVPFQKEFNREMLVVGHLRMGRYELRIDGQAAGEYSAAELKTGVNLAENANTPQYQQSAEATRINGERTKTAARIRDVVSQKYALSRAKFDVFDAAALQARVKQMMAESRNPRVKALAEDLENPGALDRQYEEQSAALYKACQPRPHHFALVRK